MDWIKNVYVKISRIVKLEDRVSELEKKFDTLQRPHPDIKESLEYSKEWNFYLDRATGEQFCSTCIGNGKKIPVKITDSGGGDKGWYCQNCKASFWKGLPSASLPRESIPDY